jgi:hypothetical protein
MQRSLCRAHVLNLFTQLKTLDGKAVQDAEREDAPRCVRQTLGMLDVMIQNACSAHKLVRNVCAVAGICCISCCCWHLCHSRAFIICLHPCSVQ